MIVITSFKKLTIDYIEKFILSNYDAIYKSLNTKPPLASNTLHFLGKEYSLAIFDAKYDLVYAQDNSIYVYTKNNNFQYIKSLIHTFYATEMEKIVKNELPNINIKFNISFPVIFDYKNVSTYFGECFPKRRKIILATKLAKYDPIYIKSVIYHEYAHFFYNNHQNEFYNLLEKVFPNYKLIQKSLRKIKYNDIY